MSRVELESVEEPACDSRDEQPCSRLVGARLRFGWTVAGKSPDLLAVEIPGRTVETFDFGISWWKSSFTLADLRQAKFTLRSPSSAIVKDARAEEDQVADDYAFEVDCANVLEDAAAEWESGMAITSPIEYRPAPTLAEPWARATLAALAGPRARA